MTFLRATAPRVYVDQTPFVERYPLWSPGVLYQTGSVVSRNFQDTFDSDSDSVYYAFYVAQNDIKPGEPSPENNTKNWLLLTSGDPNLKNFFTDSEIYDFVDAAETRYDSYFEKIDSDIVSMTNEVNHILGFDSEIKKIQHDIEVLESKKLIESLFDSDAQDGKAIAWDSDANKFKFITPVLSINNVFPSSDGNIEYSFTVTKTGSRDARPDSDQKGTIFIVIGDSDSDYDGVTYSFTDLGWTRMIGFTDRENEARYVDAVGDTMLGPLLLSRDPLTDSEAATKAYVDTFNDSDKQDKIIVLDSEVDLIAYPKENGRIYYVKANSSLWLYDANALKKFVIPRERIFDPVFLEATAVNKILGAFDIRVRTYRFSSQLGGTFRLYRNNKVTPRLFAPASNIQGTFDAGAAYQNCRLLDASLQEFTIKVPVNFEITDTWYLDFYSHDGVLTQITIDGNANQVAFSESNRILNFGEY